MRRSILATIAAGTALALVTACGSTSTASNDSSAPPKTELTHALHALTTGSALTTTVSLDTTGSDIVAIGHQGGGTGGPTLAQANLIAGGRIVVEVQAPDGKKLDDTTSAGADAVSVSVDSGTTTYVGLRLLNHTIYLQVDLKDILAAAGHSSEYATLVARVASFPAFVKALVAGKWVALPLSAISSLESLLKGAEHGKFPSNPQLLGLAHQLEATLLGDLNVTRSSTGTTDHLAVAANLRTFAHDALAAITNAIPALSSQVKPSAADTVPNRDLHLDAFVTDGALSKATIDLGQFSKKKKFTLPVVATFARSGADISVPAGATAVSFSDLISLFEVVGTSSSSSSSGSGTATPVPGTSPAVSSSAAPSSP